MATVRLFKHYIPTVFLVLGAVEAAIFVGAIHAGVILRFWDGSLPQDTVAPVLPKAVTFALVMLLSMIAMGLYQRSSMASRTGMTLRIAASFILAIIPLSLAFYIAPALFLGRGALGLAFMVAFVGILGARMVFLNVTDLENLKRRVLVLGTGQKANLISQLRSSGGVHGSVIAGYVRMNGETPAVDPRETVELDGPLARFVLEHRINELVVAVDDRRKALPVHEILDCKMSGVDVVDLLTFFEKETGKVKLDVLQPSWMFLSDGFQRGLFRAYVKRLFDIAASLVLLPLALPLMGLVALAVYVESGFRGPIFYRQVRAGANGAPFRIVKFRSMSTDAEGDGQARWAQRNDTRITPVGRVIRKSRLDELPQLFNVLKGDMSFVGPRPERPEFVGRLQSSCPHYAERHRVRPGLTGWAQIYYPYGASDEDAFQKLQYDLYYVTHRSVYLDLMILLQTVEVVLWGRGVR